MTDADRIEFELEHTTVSTVKYTAESRDGYCPECGHFGVYCIAMAGGETGTFFFWCPQCMKCPYDLRTSQPTTYMQQVIHALTKEFGNDWAARQRREP